MLPRNTPKDTVIDLSEGEHRDAVLAKACELWDRYDTVEELSLVLKHWFAFGTTDLVGQAAPTADDPLRRVFVPESETAPRNVHYKRQLIVEILMQEQAAREGAPQ